MSSSRADGLPRPLAWERFVAGEEPREVRGDVLTSWRRSRFNGVDPEYVEPPRREVEVDTRFTRVAVPIMSRTAELLGAQHSSLALSDSAGAVLWRWVSEPMLRDTLDELSVAEGFCFDEEHVGTNGLGTALETGRLAVVRGSEHFVHRFHDVTCVAAPVREPLGRRVVGAVNLTCRAEHTNPLQAVVVGKLVDEIEAELLRTAGARERRLLQAFLEARRAASGPVLALGDEILIANAAAAAELGADPFPAWEDVRRGRAVPEPELGRPLRVRMLHDGVTPEGALLTTDETAAPRRLADPPDDAARWERWRSRAARLIAVGPLLVRGEPGTGKATLLREVLGADVIELDAAQAVDAEAWAAALTAPDARVLLRHVDRLPARLRPLLDSPARLGMTYTDDETRPHDGPARLLRSLHHEVLALPPLRRRGGDAGRLAAEELRRIRPDLTFDAEARTALRRHDWPGNLRELAAAIRFAAGRAKGAAVTVADLPEEVAAATGRRVLTPLERAEAAVIAAVLRECGGNKSAAAKELGISRSALYAKLRAYRL